MVLGKLHVANVGAEIMGPQNGFQAVGQAFRHAVDRGLPETVAQIIMPVDFNLKQCAFLTSVAGLFKNHFDGGVEIVPVHRAV